ncbi:Heat shock cognate protein [Echinococcus granulosus]|uniref:Heat shock cognate protein n=1 Tax=Echinococcus granulosus TaxID=6210 RepID=W6UNP1_ECHGR|nr:Heat shock cognate protein [Echinococcus granulosus]EUB54964.1 Heat shock cognate protein [Echinococcus granulosus]
MNTEVISAPEAGTAFNRKSKVGQRVVGEEGSCGGTISQRQATIDAGKIAGLNVLRLINEPTAAAIAYAMDTRSDRQRNVLIFDWGGATFNVSILSIRDGKFEVRAVGGDTHLGGEDVYSRLLDYCVGTFKRKFEGKYLTTDMKGIGCLRKAYEVAKKLSSVEFTNMEVESLIEGIDFSVTLARTRFEHLCSDLFDGTMNAVKMALVDAELDKADIHEILLGERTKTSDNYFLGEFHLTGFPAVRRGEIEFKMPFEIDANGILHVSAVEKSTEKQKSITITDYKCRLSKREIERKPLDAEKFKQDEEKERSRVAAMNVMVDCIYSMERKMEKEEMKQKISEECRQNILSGCEETIEWTKTEKEARKED